MQEHKKTRLAQKKLGFKTIEEWDKAHEKKLSKITTKGVVKLFNSIYEFRKKIRDEKVKEGNFEYINYFLIYFSQTHIKKEKALTSL